MITFIFQFCLYFHLSLLFGCFYLFVCFVFVVVITCLFVCFSLFSFAVNEIIIKVTTTSQALFKDGKD